MTEAMAAVQDIPVFFDDIQGAYVVHVRIHVYVCTYVYNMPCHTHYTHLDPRTFSPSSCHTDTAAHTRTYTRTFPSVPDTAGPSPALSPLRLPRRPPLPLPPLLPSLAKMFCPVSIGVLSTGLDADVAVEVGLGMLLPCRSDEELHGEEIVRFDK